MEHTFVYQAAAMVQRQHRRRNWRTVFTALAAVVVFVTVYMLILPAITMERPTFCGMEEHVHTDECYTWELVCTEGEPVQGPADGLPEGGEGLPDSGGGPEDGGVLPGPADDGSGDETTDAEPSAPESGTPAQPEPDPEPDPGTPESGPTLPEDGKENVTAVPTAVTRTLARTAEPTAPAEMPEEPTEAPEEPDTEPEPPAEIPEEPDIEPEAPAEAPEGPDAEPEPPAETPEGPDTEPETPTETPEEPDTEPEAPAETPEEPEPPAETPEGPDTEPETPVEEPDGTEEESGVHHHTQACYRRVLVCGQEEHTHTDACYEEPVYICGMPEHTHDEACYDETGALICELEEHQHTEECLAPEEPELDPALLDAPLYRRVDDMTQLETGTAYILVGRDGDGTPYLVTYGEDGMDIQYVTMQECLDEDGQPCAALIVEGEEEDESLPPESLWFAQDGEALENDQIEEAASTQLSSVTDPEKVVDVSTNDEGGWAVTDPDSPVAMMAMDAETEAVYDIEVYAAATTNGCPPDCTLDAKIDPDNWVTPTGTNPFGTAQEYNLFLLGNMTNWGEVHGNAAIWGNINGTNQHITYDAGSLHDYSAYVTPKYEVGLILGGIREEGKTDVTVRNGSTISTTNGNEGIDMDVGLDEDHRHIVDSKEMDSDPFFEKAKEDLLKRNSATFIYANGLLTKNDGHLGTVRWLRTADCDSKLNIAGDTEDDHPDDIMKRDVMLVGTDPFYNVFNLDAKFYSAKTGNLARELYLDVPFGSYTVINIIGDDTVVDSFAPKLRYRDSNGVYIDQPCDKSQNDDYTQTQRTLVNFDPNIQEVIAPVAGYYLYASVLGPDVKLTVPLGGHIHMQGTIVLEEMDCKGENNNSSVIYNPFLAGSKLTITKDVVCDTSRNEVEDGNCAIEDQNKLESKWAGYYADIFLQSVEDEDGSVKWFPLKRLPMNGESLILNGLTPGEYRVIEERVYKEVEVDEETRQLEADVEGYLFYYEKDVDGDTTETKVYCDTAGKRLTNLSEKVKDPILLDHSFSHASFNGDDATLFVESGYIDSVKVTNHYQSGATTEYAVRKRWTEEKTDATNKVTTYIIDAPESARIKVDLYRRPQGDMSNEYAELVESVYLDAGNKWYYCWTGLPELGKDKDGNTIIYQYYAVESEGWPGYIYDKENSVFDEETDIMTFVNKKKDIGENALTVEKYWYDENGNTIPDTGLSGFQSRLSLYQQSGTMKDKNEYDGLPTITVKLEDGTIIGEPYPYFPGGDVDMSISLWVDGTYAATADRYNPLTCFELKDSNKTIPLSAEYITNKGGGRGYLTNWEIVGRLAHVSGNTTLVLEYDEIKDTTHSLVETGTERPLPTFTERPTAEYIDWRELKQVETPPDSKLGTVTLPEDGSADAPWSYTWTNLPTETVENGVTTYHRYYVLETNQTTEGYVPTYEIDGKPYEGIKLIVPNAPNPNVGDMPGVTSGFIIVKNREEIYYELPETGGIGTVWYQAGGGLLLAYGLSTVIRTRREGRRRRRT